MKRTSPGGVFAVAIWLIFSAGINSVCQAQRARITEERRTIPTYPYYEPNPVPVLTKDTRLYPYHTFQSYTMEAEDRDWTVVTLENDYIQVFVLPEVGGKVWGAVEKSSGHEFIYRNEVLKFRDISLRGPWTSGGIEFNFGVIGHTPSTASPVDYRLQENEDGSVSVFVGAMDLPSRTDWRVEVRLPADKAYFETNVLWTNPTPLTQPYYNWMTGAAFAREDLVVSFPGNQYLEHGGRALPWPFDAEGRQLSNYAANDFGPSKSYHVVGEFKDFFGGYYATADYGFGHWASYSDMPGQKLWLWALSRSGGIWEDLLTDTDGQYIEFQAGRLLVQYSPGDHQNPITQAGFEPYATDRWRELWFPVEGIGGLSDASSQAAMFVEATDGVLQIGINPFESTQATVQLRQQGALVGEHSFSAAPMGVVSISLPFDTDYAFEVLVPELGLHFRSDPTESRLQRPFETDPAAFAAFSEPDRLVFDADELLKARRYADAAERYEAALTLNPWHREALEGYAEILYRQREFVKGIELTTRLLQMDAYDARANYLAALHYRGRQAFTDAKEALGWASRSMAFRSASHALLAEIALVEQDYEAAVWHARSALDYDRYSIAALASAAVAGRKAGRRSVWVESIESLLAIDPLNHFAYIEKYLDDPTADALDDVRSVSRGEFPEQPFLEVAVRHVNTGQVQDALRVLELGDRIAPSQVGRLWMAFLNRTNEGGATSAYLASAKELTMGSPFRSETVRVLAWAVQREADWTWQYLLGLNYWAINRTVDAARIMESLGNTPDYAPFFVARAALLRSVLGRDEEADLRRAVELDRTEPATWRALILYLQQQERWVEAMRTTEQVVNDYHGPSKFEVLQARSLVHLGRPLEAIAVLDGTQVLPSEGSAGGHDVYALAHALAGLEDLQSEQYGSAIRHFRAGLEWPENLGAGRPYDPEERLLRALLAAALVREGDASAAREEWLRVVSGTEASLESSRFEHILGILAFRKLNDEGAAAGLIRRLAQSGHADDAATRWVVARGRQSLSAAGNIEADYPALFEALEVRVVQEAVNEIE